MEFAQAVAARGCTGAPTVGALALESAVLHAYSGGGLYPLGIYSCRRIAGSDSWSVHAEGRAVDLGILAGGMDVGSDLLRRLLRGGDATLQRIIWDRQSYSREHPAGTAYTGPNPHTDHLHIELSWAAARGEIPLELALDQDEEEDDMPMLIVAYAGAQFVVDPALTAKRGLASSEDVEALLRVDGGRAYRPATLSAALMARIPNAV